MTQSPYKILTGDVEGAVTIEQLNDWLESWMPFGSDEKEMHLGRLAYVAITSLANEQRATGWRIGPVFNETGKITTPFGYVKPTMEKLMPEGDILAVDNLAIGLSAYRSQSFATNIKAIKA